MRLPRSPVPVKPTARRGLLPATLLLSLLGLSLCGASGAAAQPWVGPSGEPSEEAVTEARALYARGSEAAEEQRWSDAIDHFERSYSLSGAAVALYSLGYTLRAVGRFRDARDAFDQLLEDPSVDDDLRAQATPLREEVADKVAVLSLGGLELHDDARVQLDAVEVEDTGQRPLPVETDPGEHALRVDAPGFAPFEWRGSLGGGDRLTVRVELEAASTPWYQSPWLWVGAGTALVIAGIITAVIVQGNAQLDPRTEYHLEL